MNDVTEPTAERADSDAAARLLVAEPPADLVDSDLLVEEVSIDGMCGVY